ncbi:MAG: hypothetical protein ACHQYP_00150 [Nitrospiria bacterium]
MPNILSRIIANKTIFLGGVILGFAGAVIGYYLGEWISILIGIVLGSILGGFVGTLGAQIFFSSVLMGALVLGFAGYRIGGWDLLDICAGTGAAMGGFIGIVIENYIKSRKKKYENRFMDSGLCGK